MVYRFLKYLIFLIILSNYFVLRAQSSENNFDKILIEIDGEQVHDVGAITQDHKGYIWMATNFGLVRYNGLESTKYYSSIYDAPNDKADIRTLFVDSQGDLWIGALSGLSKYNPDCDCLYRYPDANDAISITGVLSIAEDKNQDLWFGTRTGGLYRYNKENNVLTRILHEPSDPVNLVNDRISELIVDHNDNLWIGTNTYDPKNSSGLIRYNIGSGVIKQFLHEPNNPNSLLNNRISALYEDQQGRILIGTYKSGFHIYDPQSESITRISMNSENPNQIHAPYTEEKVFGFEPFVNLIHQDQNGGYWIGTTGKGINYFNTTTGTFKNYTFNLVNPQYLWSFFEDKQGNIWIGGIMGSGLYRTDLFARKYHLNTKLTNAEAAYESPLNPGVLWVKSQETALSKIHLETNKIINYLHDEDDVESIGHNWVRSIYQENRNTLWVGLGNGGAYGGHDGNGGIGQMDIESETFTYFKLTRNDDGRNDFSYTVYSICEDHEGYLWLGAGPGGIFRSDKDKKEFKHFPISKDHSSSGEVYLNIARIDSNGDIWASDFAGEGTLYLYDRQENMFKPFLKGFKMYNLFVDEKGWYLISTWEKGLVHLNPVDRTFIQYTKKDGLPSNVGLDIVEGENGIFWVGTRIGPAKFNSETGKISSVGLPKRRYYAGIMKASNNQIYVGSGNGLSSFYPDQVIGNPYPPQVDVSELWISDTSYLSGKGLANEISLSYDQNDIAIKFVGLHYSNPEKNSYHYKLDPLDDHWISTGFERTVRFANLSPGTYNFQVKASNSDGVWSDKSASVKFTIIPPWWTRWWAYTIYVAIAIAFADRFYRFQLSRKLADSESKKLKELNQFKNRLYTNITHEFRTPLTVIKGMTGAIKSDFQNKEFDDLENSLEMINRNSDGLLLLVNEMLDLAKLESGKMELQMVQADVIPFIKYLGESFSALAEENRIMLTIYSEIEKLLMDFDANKLTSVFSNLLSNAIKFTPESGKIIVHIKQLTQKENTYLFIKIKDSGIGIDTKELSNIFNRFYQADASTIRKKGGTGIGLALTKELVDLMKGRIEAISTIDEGSEFTVLIPVSTKAPIAKDIQPGKVPHASISNKFTGSSKQIPGADSELPLVLIIEDNMDVVHYLETCLRNRYETMHAGNGIEGIQMALENIPDIIISDVMMPGKDGFEVCETLKSDERTDHIPIIILTAKATYEDRLKGLSFGADAYLAKPFIKEELFTRLDQLVSVRKKLIIKIQKEGFNTLLKKRTLNPKLLFLQKVEKLIHEDLGNSDFGPVELAKKLLISESQLYRKAKAITGKSPAIFIRSVRLLYAKDVLINTDKTVSEVAYEVGFNDPSYFSRSFKDEFGFSPSSAAK